MSTTYDLTCTKCGRCIGWGESDRAPSRSYSLVDLPAVSRELTAVARAVREFSKRMSDTDWKIELTHWQFSNAELAHLASDCEHEFEVMDGDGYWLEPSHYPDGTKASNAFYSSERGEVCSGRGSDSR